MPELPEVEVVRRGLADLLKDQPRIEKFEFRRRDLRDPLPISQLKLLAGARILKIERRAKYLIFSTEKGQMLSHLGMTGTWRLEREDYQPELHDHVNLYLDGGRVLVYRDPRRFGILDIIESKSSKRRLQDLGPEPWDASFTADYLWALSRKRKVSIKSFIMDQKTVVGVGNIYASEALFRAQVRPARSLARFSKAEFSKIIVSIQETLGLAIEAGGSSIQDFYSFGGLKGGFQEMHFVYDRAGQPCRRCNTLVRSRVLAGRNSFWCPTCQR